MTQTVAQKIERCVARVVAWTESVCSTIDDRFLTPHIQQRTDDWDLRVEHVDDCAIVHSLEPCQPRAADEMHQHSFHLVVRCMTHGNSLGMDAAGLLHKEAITKDTGRFFNGKFFRVGKGTYIPTLDH